MNEVNIDIDCLTLGSFQTNCYVIRKAGDAACWVVDPAEETEPLLDMLREKHLTIEGVVVTHGHADHIAGVEAVMQAWPDAVFVAPAKDVPMLEDAFLNLSALFVQPMTAPAADRLLNPGDTLEMGGATWTTLDTSGHTPGGVSFYCPAAEVVIAGDALFRQSVGRTDFPGGDSQQLIANINANLLTLPEQTRVLAGHGPATTIGHEKRNNPYL